MAIDFMAVSAVVPLALKSLYELPMKSELAPVLVVVPVLAQPAKNSKIISVGTNFLLISFPPVVDTQLEYRVRHHRRV